MSGSRGDTSLQAEVAQEALPGQQSPALHYDFVSETRTRRLQESGLGKVTKVWGNVTFVFSLGSRALSTVLGIEGRRRLVEKR